ARGNFWRAAERDTRFAPDDLPAPAAWPCVVAVVPARDEADVIGEAVTSLLTQDYPGEFSIVVVDDQSSDGTDEAARAAALKAGASGRLYVLRGSDPPPGWTGKLNAMANGVHTAESMFAPDY